MANDDKSKFGEEEQQKDEGALGNLPPLSDFDSSGGFSSDAGLPPLAAFDSDKQKDSVGGLPPISDLHVETPMPTGGAIKASPPGYEVGQFDSPSFETPVKKSKGGFQDLAADSDFSPETPEIGPGPDSDVDTPMFDSAFGGPGAGGFTPTFETPAQTQAMETPMFGGPKPAPQSGAFDEGAFGAGGFDAGTPMPDFSPDTAFQSPGAATPAPKASPISPAPKAPKGGGGGGGNKGMLIAAGLALVAFIIGLVANPYLSAKVSMIPNSFRDTAADQELKIKELQARIDKLTPMVSDASKPAVSPEQIDALIAKQQELTKSVETLTSQQRDAQANFDKASGQLDQVKADLENKNEEFVKAQEAFEDLQNQTSIVQARQSGLIAEVDRLTGLVGTLEDANIRKRATKEALQASVDRLMTQVKEGIPLTPEKYAHETRVANAERLKQEVTDAKWVTPELLDQYTSLYQNELQIAGANDYFFAKIIVTNPLNEKETKWAECLMKGNWAVYYRTIDGKNVGVFENVAPEGAVPKYGFREDLPEKVQKELASEIIASRAPDFEQKLKVIAEKQAITDGPTSKFQKVFSSL